MTSKGVEFMAVSDFRVAAIGFVLLLFANRAPAQNTPASPDRPWHALEERSIASESKSFRGPRFTIDPAKTYTLAELIDLAEAHNPETRVAWENALRPGCGGGNRSQRIVSGDHRLGLIGRRSRGGSSRRAILPLDDSGVSRRRWN